METLRERSRLRRCKCVTQDIRLMKATDATQTKPHNHCRRNRTSLFSCYLPSAVFTCQRWDGGRGTFCTCVLSHDTQLTNHCLNVHVTRERPTHCWCANVCDTSKQIRPRKSWLTWSSDAVSHTQDEIWISSYWLFAFIWKVPSDHVLNRKFHCYSENLYSNSLFQENDRLEEVL